VRRVAPAEALFCADDSVLDRLLERGMVALVQIGVVLGEVIGPHRRDLGPSPWLR